MEVGKCLLGRLILWSFTETYQFALALVLSLLLLPLLCRCFHLADL